MLMQPSNMLNVVAEVYPIFLSCGVDSKKREAPPRAVISKVAIIADASCIEHGCHVGIATYL
jgi:hypothetical protein